MSQEQQHRPGSDATANQRINRIALPHGALRSRQVVTSADLTVKKHDSYSEPQRKTSHQPAHTALKT